MVTAPAAQEIVTAPPIDKVVAGPCVEGVLASLSSMVSFWLLP